MQEMKAWDEVTYFLEELIFQDSLAHLREHRLAHSRYSMGIYGRQGGREGGMNMGLFRIYYVLETLLRF